MIQAKIFDRQNYLNLLAKRIGDLKDGYRQNLAIVGDEMVGKTSLIFKFLDKFLDNRIIILYLEARPESANTFVRRFIATLLYNFLINSGLPLKEDLDYLIVKSQKYIPKTTEKIKFILNASAKRKKNDIFAALLQLPESIYEETGKHSVVILDEFHNLEGLGFNNLYREWSRVLVQQKNTMYIITSSLKFKTRLILAKHLSLLFGNFEVITVEPFDIKTSNRYLGLKLAPLGIEDSLKDFLVHFTGGHPFYLEVIADSLLKSNQRPLADTLEGLLFLPSGILNQRFSNYIRRFSETANANDYIRILYLVSSGHNKVKDICAILRKSKKELESRIMHLMELDTLSRNADFLKVNDRLLGFWLRFVYQEKLQSLTFDAKTQKEKFRDNLNNLIQEFIFSAQKPVFQRLSEILGLFQDESVQIERKKIRLNHFREIKPLSFSSGALKEGLIGRSSDSLWIMAFKNEALEEEDIVQFLKECKKYRHKQQRKIIVTLQDIDSNTRLKALEEKIWAWDISNLNQFMDLFSKPRVIAYKEAEA